MKHPQRTRTADHEEPSDAEIEEKMHDFLEGPGSSLDFFLDEKNRKAAQNWFRRVMSINRAVMEMGLIRPGDLD